MSDDELWTVLFYEFDDAIQSGDDTKVLWYLNKFIQWRLDEAETNVP